MPVLLRQSRDLPEPSAHDVWFAVTDARGRGPEDRKLPDLARKLESAYDRICPIWWEVAKTLASEPTAELASAPVCAGYGSDFGLMMAWGRLTEETARDRRTCLVICDDPWLFRHLSMLPGVESGSEPPLLPTVLRLRLRGVLARIRLVVRLAWSSLATRDQRRAHSAGDLVILVYGHPRSSADGSDAYFGALYRDMPHVKRALHTDCFVAQASALAADMRTASLHAWGSPWRIPGIVFVRWRPTREQRQGRYGWLVSRAAEIEGSGGAHPMNAWQRMCQEAWLAAVKPAAVAWPWENFGWERALCRTARRLGVTTVGYQHTAIGPHQVNYSPATNADGDASLPDTVVCSGQAYMDQLIDWGFPKERLVLGGSLRIAIDRTDHYDPDGPVFVALSGLLPIARQQIVAAGKIAASGRRVLIKEHPMYPIDFDEADGITKTDVPLAHHDGLSAVLYSTGTTGLEALYAGLPAIRLLPEDRIAINVLPENIEALSATADEIVGVVANAGKPVRHDLTGVLAPVDMDVWQRVLAVPAGDSGGN